MITTLHIKNIGIIDDIVIDLNKGLNALTGETGAGKTLIVDSLGIIAGGRFSKDMIRRGQSMSFVELALYLPENPNAIDGNVVVSREINTSGKNLCKINGRLVTVNELKNFMKNIIDIHGQYDNQTLMDTEFHTRYLDKLVGEKMSSIHDRYIELYNEYVELNKKIKNNYGDEIEKQRKLDLLEYQYKEIKSANLKQGEDEQLEEKRKIIMSSEKVAESLNNVSNNLEGTIIDVINDSIRALEKIEDVNNKYSEKLVELKNIYYEVQEVARDIFSMKEDVYFDEEERNYIEDRLDLIHTLKRKYGNTIEEILEYKESIEKEIGHIENLDEINQKLKNRKREIENELLSLGKKLHDIRKEKSQELIEKINQELVDLEMKNAKINIHVDFLENEYLKTGMDNVNLYIATNVGEEEKELSKIASGGEMSRTMLAIKKVLADFDNMPVLIFDEIDTGISGKAARAVAVKLKAISEKHQVLCISHLPNIAAMADHNYYISKDIVEERTKTKIKVLKENEVIEEIARISSGEINEATLKYAKELRNKKAS